MTQLITPEYAELIRRHHEDLWYFGNGAGTYYQIVADIAAALQTKDVLDYGCGKGGMGELLGFSIKEYDPAIPEKSAIPEPADIVVCASVLEHVEPEFLDAVLSDLRRCVLRCGFFVVPHNPAVDFLPDGRNAHRTVKSHDWWKKKIGEQFYVHSVAHLDALTVNHEHSMMIGSRTYLIVK